MSAQDPDHGIVRRTATTRVDLRNRARLPGLTDEPVSKISRDHAGLLRLLWRDGWLIDSASHGTRPGSTCASTCRNSLVGSRAEMAVGDIVQRRATARMSESARAMQALTTEFFLSPTACVWRASEEEVSDATHSSY
jgi:hypothetical protein